MNIGVYLFLITGLQAISALTFSYYLGGKRNRESVNGRCSNCMFRFGFGG